MRLTLSVRSFQVPATPFTRACPPSLPSEPTSRATRVTSEAKLLSWPTMVLTTLPMRRNSPRKGRPSVSSSMDWLRSPLATAPITRATSTVGCTMSPIMEFTELMHSLQHPVAPSSWPRSLMRPSLPTTFAIRSSSLASPWFRSAISLKASAISPSIPIISEGRRTEKSPFRKARKTLSSSLRSSCDVADSTCGIRPPVTPFRANGPAPLAVRTPDGCSHHSRRMSTINNVGSPKKFQERFKRAGLYSDLL